MTPQPAGYASEPLVRIDKATKVYQTRSGPIHALDQLSLDIGRGEFLSIVGPSGCGKSTLLLMCAGLVPRTSGAITIDQVLVQKPYTNLGIVFQDAVLLDWRRVIENLMLQVEMRRLDKRQYLDRAHMLLRLVGLSGFERRYAFELSGGMRQRVSICRALLHDPPLLLMDEPFGALDALTRDQLNLDLQNIWLQSRKTVLFITHSITEAVFLADRVVVMSARPGKIERILKIEIPRPRRLAVRETSEFGQYVKEIRAIFSSLGILREDLEATSAPGIDARSMGANKGSVDPCPPKSNT
jgi:NitT/TauT family transport system ATP-binding protein